MTKTQASIRFVMCHGLSTTMPLYIVTEYPKSGGTWVSQILAELMELPFYRNQFPEIKSQLVHCHYRYHPRLKNVFCVLRDGRDVMVSFYYHSLFLRDDWLNYHEFIDTSRALKISDPGNIQENLQRFIEYKFTAKNIPRFSWSEFVLSWLNREVPIIKYEEMLTCPEKSIKKALDHYSIEASIDRVRRTISKYSFKNLSGRNSGQEDKKSFLRKGISGDWKTHFSLEAKQVFNYYAGDVLVKLGYEKDNSWVK
jgi:hypothetical protein